MEFYKDLTPFQRILLTTVGAVTDTLEAYYLEDIKVVKIHQSVKYDELLRKVLLQGNNRVYVYAESVIDIRCLDDSIVDGLFDTDKPIGLLIAEAQLETRREILRSWIEPAGEISGYFNISPYDNVVCRVYRIFTNGEPFITITEKFPMKEN